MSLEEYLVPYRDIANICWDCQRACGGSSWTTYDRETDTIRFETVPGWTAEPSVIYAGSYRGRQYKIATYHITACPLFVPDPPRESNPGELDEEQLRQLMRKWMQA